MKLKFILSSSDCPGVLVAGFEPIAKTDKAALFETPFGSAWLSHGRIKNAFSFPCNIKEENGEFLIRANGVSALIDAITKIFLRLGIRYAPALKKEPKGKMTLVTLAISYEAEHFSEATGPVTKTVHQEVQAYVQPDDVVEINGTWMVDVTKAKKAIIDTANFKARYKAQFTNAGLKVDPRKHDFTFDNSTKGGITAKERTAMQTEWSALLAVSVEQQKQKTDAKAAARAAAHGAALVACREAFDKILAAYNVTLASYRDLDRSTKHEFDKEAKETAIAVYLRSAISNGNAREALNYGDQAWREFLARMR